MSNEEVKTIRVETYHLDKQVDTDAPCIVLDNTFGAEVMIGRNQYVNCSRIRIDFRNDIGDAYDDSDWVIACVMEEVEGKVKSRVPVLVKGDKNLAKKVCTDLILQVDRKLITRHIQQMKALKEQIQAPWSPLRELLKLDQFRADVVAKIPAFCEVKSMEDYLAEQAPKMELRGEKHWLATLGVQYLTSHRYCMDWEDIEYHPKEVVKYLQEARQGLLAEILKIIGASGRDRVFYLSKVDIAVNTNVSLEIHLKALYKVEEQDDTRK
jgi:hypothetical protein